MPSCFITAAASHDARPLVVSAVIVRAKVEALSGPVGPDSARWIPLATLTSLDVRAPHSRVRAHHTADANRHISDGRTHENHSSVRVARALLNALNLARGPRVA